MHKKPKIELPRPTLPSPFCAHFGVTLYWGDCAQILPLLPKADILLTDPPYGIGVGNKKQGNGCIVGGSATGRKKGSSFSKKKYKDASTQFAAVEWDDDRPPSWLLQMMVAHATNAIVWGGNYFADVLPASPCWLQWDKHINGDFADVEMAWTNFPRAARLLRSNVNRLPDAGDTAMFEYTWNGMLQGHLGGNSRWKEKRLHPTQKPVPLMQWCLQLYPPIPTLVIDPMAGSGTVGIACQNLNIPCILIERERHYCEMIATRLKENAPLPLGEAHIQNPEIIGNQQFDEFAFPCAV